MFAVVLFIVFLIFLASILVPFIFGSMIYDIWKRDR